jgi:beta-glucosidase
VIPGQTILDGIEHAAHDVTFSQDASASVPAGAEGIVVVGETPYAEGFGDVGGPQWAYDPGDGGVPRPAKTMQLSDADKAAVAKVCAAAASCTVVVVSGRPMVIDPDLLSQIDALVASWLPGSEGEGVADVLFGKADFTGRLSVTWPRSVSQEPINVGDANYDPLYPYGWGLRTGHH